MVETVKRFYDKNGQYLYKDYDFLEDFKGINTLLFVMNNVIVSFSLNNNIVYNTYSSERSLIKGFMKYDDFKKNILNDSMNDYDISFLKSCTKLNRYKKNLMCDVNDWLNDGILIDKKYKC